MRSLSISRPTPAFVVAFIALLFAMAGTGYAAATISGASIQKQSVPANRVKPNVLGGRQINEAKLGAVPEAVHAQTADKALLADKATEAETALTANKANQADKATLADKATDADQLGGRADTAYLRSARTVRSVLTQNVAVNAGAESTASCAGGEIAIAGGGAWYLANTDTTIGSGTLSASLPITDGQGVMTGWRAEGKNTSGAVRDFRSWVVCTA
jgi:murein DD-endopeptidase MepM/ murein hydrolase activator NlpD